MRCAMSGGPLTWLRGGAGAAIVLIVTCMLLGSSGPYAKPLPVIPDVGGFGCLTPAGRGGEILKVINLNNSGPGSLRAAVSHDGPRIIVFEVSGNILLEQDIAVTSPFVTIAGQTAPSPGIALVGAGVRIMTHDVLVQHLRIRVGAAESGPPPDNRDALQILGPDAANVVVDHVSASWAIDENVSTWGKVKDVTIANCIIAEALHKSLHSEGRHSKGLLIGDHADRVFVSSNLLAHNYDRNPQIKGGTSTVILNNLSYNAGNDAFLSITDNYAQQPHTVSVVGNVFVNGPSTPVQAIGIKVERSAKIGTRLYLADNLATGRVYQNAAWFEPLVQQSPNWLEGVDVKPSSQVMECVLTFAGARPLDRDVVDERIVKDVRGGRGRIIDSPNEVGGWPQLAQNHRKFEAPVNPHGDDDNDGYSNIEELLQSLASSVEGVKVPGRKR